MDKKPKFSALGIPQNIDLPNNEPQQPKGMAKGQDMNNLLNSLAATGNISAIMETLMQNLMQPEVQKEIEQEIKRAQGLPTENPYAFPLTLPEDFDEVDKLSKDNSKVDCMSYNAIINPESFGVVEAELNIMLLSDFDKVFTPPTPGYYPMSLFSDSNGSITGYNLIDDMASIKGLLYLEHNDRYILFEAIPESADKERYILAAIKNRGEFSIIVPSFGNSYNTRDRIMFDKILDAELYELTDAGKVKFKYAYDLNKLKDGLNLLLFSKTIPILSLNQFGKVIRAAIDEKRNVSNGEIYIGKIKSNESKIAVMFKRDFDLREDQTIFDFYVKIKGKYSADAEFLLADLLREVDFNTNQKIQTLEVNADNEGKIYVNLDLGDTPGNLPKYFEE
jgi:hypothetical protein